MREIKFRMWDGERMYFNVQNAYDTLSDHTPPGSKLDDKERDKYTIFESSFGDVLKKPIYKIMQYTGLKDTNGKEIYEGDVMDGDGEVPEFPVVWDQVTCSFNIHGSGSLWKVIGNIYENPELLNEAEER